jgi:signal transduction histidine kinase
MTGNMAALKRIIQIPRSALTDPAHQALEAAALYAALCGLYITVSGYLATRAAGTPEQLHDIETVKGIAFVVVTGLLFFAISYLRLRRIRRQEETILVQEEALIQAERRLVAAMTAATVAHDLNNLLMTLSGLVEGLKGREGDDPFLLSMREGVEVTHSSCQTPHGDCQSCRTGEGRQRRYESRFRRIDHRTAKASGWSLLSHGVV